MTKKEKTKLLLSTEGGDLSEKNNHNILSEEFDIYKCLLVSPWEGRNPTFCIPSRVVVLR